MSHEEEVPNDNQNREWLRDKIESKGWTGATHLEAIRRMPDLGISIMFVNLMRQEFSPSLFGYGEDECP